MKNLTTIVFIFFCIIILALSIRGISGNPNMQTMNDRRWTEDGPLELSPERGRFLLTMSVDQNKSFALSPALSSVFLIGAAVVITIGISYIIHRYIEEPGMIHRNILR